MRKHESVMSKLQLKFSLSKAGLRFQETLKKPWKQNNYKNLLAHQVVLRDHFLT